MGASAGKIVPRLRGEYDANATYRIFDQVSYGVNSYALKVATATGILPTNNDYWAVVAKGISNISPEALGIGYGISSDSGSARTATLSNYSLTPNGIVAVTFAADVQAGATLNINSQGAKAIYFRGSAIVANVIKGGDTVTFAYDGTHYDILCIDGGAGHKILNSAGTELTQRDGLQFTDGLEATDDAQGAKTKVGMNLPIVSSADWNAMTEQEKTAYKASHYRFGVELPDTSGVINAEYMKLLWENQNTAQAFAPQTITLNSADYDFLLCVARRNTSYNQCVSTIVEKGMAVMFSLSLTSGSGVQTILRRLDYVSNTSYSVQASTIQTGTSTSTTDNANMIPVAIYGIKKNFQFKVNAIADTLSTRADHCFLDDETTTVEEAIDSLRVKSKEFSGTTTSGGQITVETDATHIMLSVVVKTIGGAIAQWTEMSYTASNIKILQFYNSSGSPVGAGITVTGTYYYLEV